MNQKYYIKEEGGPLTAALFKFAFDNNESLQIEFYEAKYRNAALAFRTFSKQEALQFRDALNEMFPKE